MYQYFAGQHNTYDEHNSNYSMPPYTNQEQIVGMQHQQPHQATDSPQVMTTPPEMAQISLCMPVNTNYYSTMSTAPPAGLEANLRNPQTTVPPQHSQTQAFFSQQQLIDNSVQLSMTSSAIAQHRLQQQSNSLHPPASVAQLNYNQHWQHQATGPSQGMPPPAMEQISLGMPANTNYFTMSSGLEANLQEHPQPIVAQQHSQAYVAPQQPQQPQFKALTAASAQYLLQHSNSLHPPAAVVAQLNYDRKQQRQATAPQVMMTPPVMAQIHSRPWNDDLFPAAAALNLQQHPQAVYSPQQSAINNTLPYSTTSNVSTHAQYPHQNLPACQQKKRKIATPTQIPADNPSFRSPAAAMPFPPHVAGLQQQQPAVVIQQQPIANTFPPMAPAVQLSLQVPALTQSALGQLEHCNQNQQQQQQQWQMCSSQLYVPVVQNVPMPMSTEANGLAAANLSQLTPSISPNSSTGSSSSASSAASKNGLKCAVTGCGTTRALRNPVPKKKLAKTQQKETTVKICQKCLNAFKRHINKFLELLVDEDMNIYYTDKYEQVPHNKICTLRTRVHGQGEEYNCEMCHFRACQRVGCNADHYELNEQTISGGGTDWPRNKKHTDLAVILHQLPLLPTMVATCDSFIERSLAKYRVYTATHMNWIATHQNQIRVENLNPENQYGHQWFSNDDINFLDAILDQIPLGMKQQHVDDFSTFFTHHITSAQNLSRRSGPGATQIQKMNNQIMGQEEAVQALRDFIDNADDAKKELIKSIVKKSLAKQDKDKIGLWSTMDLNITIDTRHWNEHTMRLVVAIFLLLGIAIVESDETVRSHIGEWLRFMRHRVASELFSVLKKKMGSPQSAAERFIQLIEYVEFIKNHRLKIREYLGAAQKIGMSLYAFVELTIKTGIFQLMARKEENPELAKLCKELEMQQ